MSDTATESGAHKQDVLNPYYWWVRLVEAYRGELHHAVYCCPKDNWDAISARHMEILNRTVKLNDSILDCGCGWGRLLGLMPSWWVGPYTGVDISPDFIDMARTNLRVRPRPQTRFAVGDLRDLAPNMVPGEKYDWAVLISIRGMLVGQCGQRLWDQVESEIRKYASRILYLEYDADADGVVE